MKPVVMQLITSLAMGGAERLALSILHQGQKQEHFNGIIAGLYGKDGDVASYASSMGLKSLGLSLEQAGKWQAIRKLCQTLRENKVSLLHVQAGYLLLYAVPAAKMAGIPLIYTEHALHSLRRHSTIRWALRLSAPFLQGISCVNTEIKEYFVQELGIAAQKVHHIESGIDTKLFSPSGTQADLPWKQDEGAGLFIFGTVARLTEAKDHSNLLHAFAKVVQNHAHARLLMVGDGEERQSTEQLIQQLNLQEKVHITGKCLQVPERLRSMHAFVLSSKREGLPVCILEAMATGLPVISTDVGGISSLTSKDEERLLLVPAQNATALAKAMETLLQNKELQSKVAQLGHEYIVREKNETTMAEAYFQLYKNGGLPWGF